MSEEWITILTAWLPFLLLVVAFIAFGRWQGMHSRGPSGVSLIGSMNSRLPRPVK